MPQKELLVSPSNLLLFPSFHLSKCTSVVMLKIWEVVPSFSFPHIYVFSTWRCYSHYLKMCPNLTASHIPSPASLCPKSLSLLPRVLLGHCLMGLSAFPVCPSPLSIPRLSSTATGHTDFAPLITESLKKSDQIITSLRNKIIWRLSLNTWNIF